MQTPPLDPPVSDTAPSAGVLTSYDEQHLVTYLRLLDADAEGADWREVALIVLHIDPAREPDRARRAWDSHLARARWIVKSLANLTPVSHPIPTPLEAVDRCPR